MQDSPFSGARIETPRLLLRPFVMDDLPAFQRIAGREEVLEFLPAADRMTPEQLEEVLKWLIGCYELNTPEKIRKFALAVVLRDTDELAGWCGLGPLEFDESQIELYFIISPDHWGRGLATESAQALVAYAFGPLGLQRVVAVVHPDNRASVRVLEKLGMERRGPVESLGAAHRDYEGHLLFALTAPDRSESASRSDRGR